MNELIRNDATNNVNWAHICMAFIGGLIIGLLILINIGIKPGDRIIREAKNSDALAITINDRDTGNLKVVGVEDGKLTKKCDPQLGNCKAKIASVDSCGKPTLVSSDPDNPIEIISESGRIDVSYYIGSHCQGHTSGRVHYESCCSGPGC